MSDTGNVGEEAGPEENSTNNNTDTAQDDTWSWTTPPVQQTSANEQPLTKPPPAPVSPALSEIIGWAVYYNPKYRDTVMGKMTAAVAILLAGFGAISWFGWAWVSAFQSMPSLFPAASVLAETFVAFGVAAFVFWLLFTLVTLISMTRTVMAIDYSLRPAVDNNGEFVPTAVWQTLGHTAQRRLVQSIVVQFMCLVTVCLVNSTYLVSQGLPFNAWFADYAFTATGSVAQFTATLGDSNWRGRDIARLCNVGVPFTMDTFTAQGCINLSHVNLVMSLVAFSFALVQVMTLMRLELKVAKGKGPMKRHYLVVRQKDGTTVRLKAMDDIFVALPQQPETWFGLRGPGVNGVGYMHATLGLLIVGTAMWFVMWIFDCLSVAGAWNALDSWVDDWSGLFALEMTWYTFIFVAMIVSYLYFGYEMTVTNMRWVTRQQHYRMLLLLGSVLVFTAVNITLGWVWLVDNGASLWFTEPTVTLCREHPGFRTYNAVRVLFVITYIFNLIPITEYIGFHIHGIADYARILKKKRKPKGKV